MGGAQLAFSGFVVRRFLMCILQLLLLDWANGCRLRFMGSSLTRHLVIDTHCLIWARGMLLLTETLISKVEEVLDHGYTTVS